MKKLILKIAVTFLALALSTAFIVAYADGELVFASSGELITFSVVQEEAHPGDTVDVKLYVDKNIAFSSVSANFGTGNDTTNLTIQGLASGGSNATATKSARGISIRTSDGAVVELPHDSNGYLFATFSVAISNTASEGIYNIVFRNFNVKDISNGTFTHATTFNKIPVVVTAAPTTYSLTYNYAKTRDPRSVTSNPATIDETGLIETVEYKTSDDMTIYDMPYFDLTGWEFNGSHYDIGEEADLKLAVDTYLGGGHDAAEVTAEYTKQVYCVELFAQVGTEGTPVSVYKSADYDKFYDVGASVRLTAPATYGGQDFAGWIVGDEWVQSREIYYMGTEASTAENPTAVVAVYETPEDDEDASVPEPSLNIVNVYRDTNAGKYRIIATVELAGTPDEAVITNVGFKYATTTTKRDLGPVSGNWTNKYSTDLKNARAGSYTVKFSMGTNVKSKTNPLYLCGYIEYEIDGETYHKYVALDEERNAITAVVESDPDAADTCFGTFIWNDLA